MRHNYQEANTEILSGAYDKYAEDIYRYCFFRIFNKERSEELMQEVFIKFWHHVNEGRPVNNERGLLYTIATHLVIDEKRKKTTDSLDAMLEESEINEPMAPEGEANVMKKAMLREIKDSMGKLSEDEKDLFTMRYINDMDPKEISEITRSSPNSVSVRLNRIVKKIRADLD